MFLATIVSNMSSRVEVMSTDVPEKKKEKKLINRTVSGNHDNKTTRNEKIYREGMR